MDLNMKKEENQRKNTSLKNECNYRSRSQSPKAYLGCDTCRLKKVKPNSKSGDYGTVQSKYKLKKPPLEKDERGPKTQKIKLTDLCDEDKKRIVELIEELSKLAQKNQELKEKLVEMRKERQDQQDHILQQANLFLEEKNFYANEINEYKIKIEKLENELKNKVFQWENRGKSKNSKIEYLAKALRKSLKENNELHEQMSHLKICLKHSLESFQRLRAEVTELQRQEQRIRKFTSTSCQTENNTNTWKNKNKPSDEESEEEYLSTCNQDSINAKSSLDIVNDKLEHVYQLLKRKKKNLSDSPVQKYDIDLSILLRNEKLTKKRRTEDNKPGIEDDTVKAESEDNEKFLKPFEQCNKTLMQADRILKTLEQPSNSISNECTQAVENNITNVFNCTESTRNIVKCSAFLQNNIVQKNNLFKSTEDNQYDEDRLLEDIFYSHQSLNLGLSSIFKLESKDLKKNSTDRPFTW